MNLLKNRSFVIVDMKSLHTSKKLNLAQKKAPAPQWLLEQRAQTGSMQQDYDSYLDKQNDLLECAKKNIMKEKSILKTRNPSITPVFMPQRHEGALSSVGFSDLDNDYSSQVIHTGNLTATPMREDSHTQLP